MDITEEMLWQACTAYEGSDYLGEQYDHDGLRRALEAVAPLIAAQALLVADAKLGMAPFIDRGGVPFVEREHMFGAVNRAAAELFGEEWPAVLSVEVERRKAARCPTCTGPTRETVGMVCQTCGTDYAS